MEDLNFIVSIILGLGLIPIAYYFIKFIFYKRQGNHIEAHICLKNFVFISIFIGVLSIVLRPMA